MDGLGELTQGGTISNVMRSMYERMDEVLIDGDLKAKRTAYMTGGDMFYNMCNMCHQRNCVTLSSLLASIAS